MAKFKVGDRVVIHGMNTIKGVRQGNPVGPFTVSRVFGSTSGGIDPYSATRYELKDDKGKVVAKGTMECELELLANSRCVNSTRPIVQRALNAKVACNRVVDQDGDEIRVGHDVMRAYSSDGLQMTVTKIEGNKVYFKDPTKGVCWDMAEDLIAMNGKKNSEVVENVVGDDPKTREAYKLCQAALGNLEKAKRYLDATEDDPDYPDEVRYVGRCIQDVKEALVKML